MTYNEADDTCGSPHGDLFTYIYSYKCKSKSGFVSDISIYECQGCGNCPLKPNCPKAEGNRKFHVSKDFVKWKEATRQLITSDEGKALRMNRSFQVKGAFGVLKQEYGFRRWLRRGTKGGFTEILLYAFAFNMNKKPSKNEREFEGVIRHSPKVS